MPAAAGGNESGAASLATWTSVGGAALPAEPETLSSPQTSHTLTLLIWRTAMGSQVAESDDELTVLVTGFGVSA